jgi:ribosomal protein RSM22 (predicted rRNA methylase)
MELPPLLRRGVDDALDGISLASLSGAVNSLSRRYRDEVHDGRLHLDGDQAALAYLAARLPATFAAVHASLVEAAIARPDFTPTTALDVGAGPGTALWAATDVWPELQDVLLVEASNAVRAWGERLSANASPPRIVWRAEDLTGGLPGHHRRDLVTLAYVLGELAPAVRVAVIDRLWQLTDDVFVIVEPGTPAGWERILAARNRLIETGAHVVAPCPHALKCPLTPPDWCHFAQRVPRSRVHRTAKGGTVPWEDEKFIYLAASRASGARFRARVIARPRTRTGQVWLKLCRHDGGADQQLLTRRDGLTFKEGRRVDWGDSLGEGGPDPLRTE